MFGKGSKIYAMLMGCCPNCHGESMYKNQNPYALLAIYEMYEKCSKCSTVYKMEPSFFYGAMYVSYGLGVGLSILVFCISYLLLHASILVSFVAIMGCLFLLMPVIMRLARNIWINFFIHYQQNG
jgi:hypothetical protein